VENGSIKERKLKRERDGAAAGAAAGGRGGQARE
jgi:hypothetical protein